MQEKDIRVSMEAVELGLAEELAAPLISPAEGSEDDKRWKEKYEDTTSDDDDSSYDLENEAEAEQPPPLQKKKVSKTHAAILISVMIALSSGLILFNKFIFANLKFPFPITLTTWHFIFQSLATQIMSKTTRVLDSRKSNPMSVRRYCTAILPIGIFFTCSLVCGNMVYLYLSVAFIQMLKGAAPIAVLLTTWAFRLKEPKLSTFFNICVIAVGVAIASFGETSFNLIGIILQLSGIVFESIRLVLVQKLLTPKKDQKMDAMVSLYYFAPACAVMIGCIAAAMEWPHMSLEQIMHVGPLVFLANAGVAFMLNCVTVMVIDKTSSLALTLTGVVKTVLLIISSVILFGESVTLTQVIGFSIATVALMVYQLGWDTIKGLVMPKRTQEDQGVEL